MEKLRELNDAYYRTETEGVNECKVIFLGDGTAGKSSLIERMVNGTLFVFTRYENALVTTGKMWYTTSKECRKAALS